MRLPATRGSVSQAKYFSGTNMESIIMLLKCPISPKYLTKDKGRMQLVQPVFKASKHPGAPGRPADCQLRIPHRVAGPLQCFRTQIIPPSQTYRPCTHRMEASDRSTQPLPPGKNMVDSTQGSPLKLSPPSPFWVPYISPTYFWMNLSIVLLPTVNCRFPDLKVT